jgi:hypothetical protein
MRANVWSTFGKCHLIQVALCKVHFWEIPSALMLSPGWLLTAKAGCRMADICSRVGVSCGPRYTSNKNVHLIQNSAIDIDTFYDSIMNYGQGICVPTRRDGVSCGPLQQSWFVMRTF